MFTRIQLCNFRCFDNISFDLTEKKNAPKNFAIVYGENGSGKSNLMSAFVFLSELMNTMNVRDRYEELINKISMFDDKDISKQLQEHIVSGMRDMKAIVEDYKMVDSEEPIIAHYEFSVGGNKGEYHVEIKDDEIIRERLEFKLNKRKGIYFEINKKSSYFNPGIVKDRDLLNDIKATAKRYWGKHSILAIITHEIEDKSSSFGKDNLSENFADALYELRFISCNVGVGDKEWEYLSAPISMLRYPIKGKILKSKEKQIDIIEGLFSRFFCAINSDIKKLEYKRIYSDKYIEYRLCVVRMIADTYRTIDFSKESKGNHQLLILLCYLLTACFGGIVILDEADSGIHDLLFKKIIQEIRDCISGPGQLIMTTHNTMIMESNIDRGSIYIISEESGCHKHIQCISDYDKRTYLGNNIRNKYLNNEYHGLPLVEKIDFRGMIDIISQNIDDLE